MCDVCPNAESQTHCGGEGADNWRRRALTLSYSLCCHEAKELLCGLIGNQTNHSSVKPTPGCDDTRDAILPKPLPLTGMSGSGKSGSPVGLALAFAELEVAAVCICLHLTVCLVE